MTDIEHAGYWWKNFIGSEIIPQRAFAPGLCIALVIILVFWKIFTTTTYPSKRMLLLYGVCAGLLPIIHLYSFFVLVPVTLYVVLLTSLRRKKFNSNLLFFYFPLLIISGLIINYTYHGLPHSSIQIHIGWMGPSDLLGLMWFWTKNLGTSIVLILLGFTVASRRLKVFSVPFFSLFIMSNLFTFQYNTWDNRKFLVYWFVFAAAFAGIALKKLFSSHATRTKIVAFLILYISCVSGYLDVFSYTQFQKQKIRWFSRDQLELAETIDKKTEINAVFLTAPSNTWMTILMGRQIVLGFTPWLKNFGFDTDGRQEEINAIYRGKAESFEYIKKYNVDYIIVGPQESRMPNLNEQFFKMNFPVFLQTDDHTIYAVQNL